MTRGSAANPPGPAPASAAAPAVPAVSPHRSASSGAVPPDPVDASAVRDSEMPMGSTFHLPMKTATLPVWMLWRLVVMTRWC